MHKDQHNFNLDDTFKKDILVGLNHPTKYIPSMYFYDETGSFLFDQITEHKDYYLTNCEIEILKNAKDKISKYLKGKAFNLIEFGPGNGSKAKILIQQFLKDDLTFTYMPIDISQKYLDNIIQSFKEEIPQLHINAIQQDYLKGMKDLSAQSANPNFVLFLGSNIGNLTLLAAQSFLKDLKNSLNKGDYVLIGFDLRKDINTLMNAYDDSDGITRAFNYNLLKRVNTELEANFILDNFYHYVTYNVTLGAMESYLVSTEEHSVDILALNSTIQFHAYEPIHVESSHKYLHAQIEKLAANAGFEVFMNFTDQKKYFVDSLWRAI